MKVARRFLPAQKTVKVPSRKWGSKDEVMTWARDLLAGGPPHLSAIVVDSEPAVPRPATWKDIQSGALAGKSVELRSDPPGLIVEDSVSGIRKFVPSASGVGFGTGAKTLSALKTAIGVEKKLREFVEKENAIFNKTTVANAPKARRTLMWWQHGKQINEFVLDSGEGVSREAVWQALVKWGAGMKGYGRQTHQDCSYFHDWLSDMGEDDPLLLVSTTRIQHILRIGDRSCETRDFLRRFCSSVLGSALSDDEFAWLFDERRQGWPLDEGTRSRLVLVGTKLLEERPMEFDAAGLGDEIQLVLRDLRQRPRRS